MLHPIGSGVLGPVFRAFDARQDRLVAVKTFKLDLLPEQVARLTDALRLIVTAPSAHPAVVPAIDAGLEGTTPYVVLAMAAGETLDVLLRQLAPATPGVALPLLARVAAAIDAVWDQGGSHGALHPRDVFVTPETGDVRVTGFGIVRSLEAVGAQVPARRPYAAPERAGNQAWDRRADVYSLGAIAHELLTGRRPAGTGEQDGTFDAALAPQARVAIRRVLGTALADVPESRFETLAAFVDALDAASRGDAPTIAATPPVTSTSEVAPALVTTSEVVATAVPPAIDEVTTVVPVSAGRQPRPSARAPKPATRQPSSAGGASASRESVSEPSAATVGRARVADVVEDPLRLPPRETLGLSAKDAVAAPASVQVLRSSVPWGIVAAATVAGLAVGLLGGYQLGFGRGAARGQATVLSAPLATETATALPPPVSTQAAVPPALTAADPAADTEVSLTPPASGAASGTDLPARASSDVQRARVSVGRLTVRSTPARALVTIDGRHAGETPLTIGDLSLGAHLVQVARPGYAPRQQRISLTPASPAQTVAVALVPGLPAQAGSATRVGILELDSDPRGARVTVDGQVVGVTPLRLTGMAAGAHVVTFALPGLRPVTARAVIEVGRLATVRVTLDR